MDYCGNHVPRLSIWNTQRARYRWMDETPIDQETNPFGYYHYYRYYLSLLSLAVYHPTYTIVILVHISISVATYFNLSSSNRQTIPKKYIVVLYISIYFYHSLKQD